MSVEETRELRDVECVWCDETVTTGRALSGISEHHMENHAFERWNPAWYSGEFDE